MLLQAFSEVRRRMRGRWRVLYREGWMAVKKESSRIGREREGVTKEILEWQHGNTKTCFLSTILMCVHVYNVLGLYDELFVSYVCLACLYAACVCV